MFQVCRDKTQNWYVTAASQIWNDDVAEKWQADNCKADKAELGTTGEGGDQISDIFIIFSGAGDQTQGDSGPGYQDPGGRRGIAITIRAEQDHNIWGTMTPTRVNNA